MTDTEQLIRDAYKVYDTKSNEFSNSDIHTDGIEKIEIKLTDLENAAQNTWIAIAEHTKDINPGLMKEVLSKKERYSNIGSRESCWMKRCWNVGTIERCAYCLKNH